MSGYFAHFQAFKSPPRGLNETGPESAPISIAAVRDQNRCPFLEVMRGHQLEFVFQPIVDLHKVSIFGYEALMRGPVGTPLHTPNSLLTKARSLGHLVELECQAALSAIRAYGQYQLGERLFVNLSAPAILALATDRGTHLFKVAVESGVAPSNLMFELTEHERVEDPEGLQTALEVFKTQGVGLALDDFGDGRSSLRLWAQLQPDIVKLDRYFVTDIHRDSRRVDIFRALVDLAQHIGSLLVAEGVEHTDELAVLRDLGCVYAQGYLLGKPEAVPARHIQDAALAVLASSKISILPNTQPKPEIGQTVHKLIVKAPALSPFASNDDVHRFFQMHPDLHAVAIVDEGYPVGLIDRRSFIDLCARRYFHELFGRYSCTRFMNATPLRVEHTVRLDAMLPLLAGNDQRYLSEGLIITEGGRYTGLATGENLVRSVTERRVEAARHANPLTFLPGNIPITEHIRRLLDAGVLFVTSYFDLNNFKPYNDLYGYWQGDEMIKLVAEIVLSHCDPSADFVGHVGGDDFIVIFQSEDWMQRCQQVIREFRLRSRTLFSEADLARNGFESEDRQGFKVVFPLTEIAVGAVMSNAGPFRSPEDIASAAAVAKKIAKRSPDCFHLGGPGQAPP